MKFYTVVPCINQVTIINTVKFCQTKVFHNNSYHEMLEHFIIKFCIYCNLPIDFYIAVNNNYALLGSDYLSGLVESTNAKFELINLTSNPKHEGFFISETDFRSLILFFEYCQRSFIKETNSLLEEFYEIARVKYSPDKPKRRESLLLFDNVENCEKYIERQVNKGVLCIVEPLITTNQFKADGNLLSETPFSYTYSQFISQAEKYWRGEFSSNPLYEYLFQGSCKLIPL